MRRSWPRIELWQGASGRWYFHKKSQNGKLTMDSQGYKEKRYAKEAIRREYPGLLVVEIEVESYVPGVTTPGVVV